MMKLKLSLFTFIVLCVTACGGKKVTSEQDLVDITRPPAIDLSGDQAFELPTNSTESVSYEEWLKENGKKAKDAK